MTTETKLLLDKWRKDGSLAVRGGTVPKTIKAGRKLMHNQVTHDVDTLCGTNGFRAWTADRVPDGFVKCPCGWSGLPHYAWVKHVEAITK